MNQPERRLGLSLRVQPSWGEPESGVESLWNEGAAEGGSAVASGTPARLDTELGYGLPALDGRGVFTLQAGFGIRDVSLAQSLPDSGKGPLDFRRIGLNRTILL